MQPHAPTYEDVIHAADTLRGHSVVTPLLTCEALNDRTGAHVFVKPECLQRTGSFKFRGAFNAISKLSDGERANGIVASSSGNHAQGIACAAKLFGARSTIIMPSDAPQLKIERTRGHGAEVVFYDRASEDREGKVQTYMADHGGTFIHPYNNSDVIAGQGTVGLEMAEQGAEHGVTFDRVLVCTGGGGLTAGVTLSIRKHFPNAKIHPVEPEGFDDYRRSLERGQIVQNEKTSGSICDAILTPAPGDIGFLINAQELSDGIVISDQEAMDAVGFAYSELKLVVEPGGAAGLAGLLQAANRWEGETIGVVISGGNVDPEIFTQAISRA